jgi:leader peptidase (prepilin peptidase)/N-methyltransferase
VPDTSGQPHTALVVAHDPKLIVDPSAIEARPQLLSRPLPVAVAASALAVLAFARYPLGGSAAIAGLMAAVLVVLAVTDLERRVIPNRVVLPAAAFVLVVRLAFFPRTAPEFVLAALVCTTVFLIPSVINSRLMGMGDVKLVLLIGVGLGWSAVGALVLAFLSVFPIALATVISGGLKARKSTLPFGPFLALGALVVLFIPHLAGFGAR